mmetsp:Transcript_26635/g.60792  ORF Transcript_26635/g.60792 Transcript_26635/m.60792 type:complete len:237 (+) Transcript_26635:1058-1768(+)
MEACPRRCVSCSCLGWVAVRAGGNWCAVGCIHSFPRRVCMLRVPLACQPRCAHAGHALHLRLHGDVWRIHGCTILPHVQREPMEEQCSLDRHVVSWDQLLHLLHLESCYLGSEVVGRRSLRNLVCPALDVVGYFCSFGPDWRLLWVPQAAHRESCQDEPNSPSGSGAAVLCQHLVHYHRGWHFAVWSCLCGGILCALVHLVASVLLLVWIPPLGAWYPVPHMLRGHRSALLPSALL